MPPHIHCWQPTLEDHALLVHAQRLYERTLDADERIPWVWIERAIIESKPARDGWHKHLILASVDGELAGLAYGAFVPGFGGYLCYVTVDDRYRKLGLGTRLYDAFFALMRQDADLNHEPLPFVLWESYRPVDDDGHEHAQLWQARTRLFQHVGGLAIDGVELQTPNYDGSGPPQVPMRVFLKPLDDATESFDHERLDLIVSELLVRVYGQDPGDPLYEATFAPVKMLRLVSAT